MSIIERLDMIDKLLAEQKPPSEIRGHILAIREQIETYSQEAEHLGSLKEENAKLVAENKKLKSYLLPPEDEAQSAAM